MTPDILVSSPFGSLVSQGVRVRAEVAIDVFDPTPLGAAQPASRWHAEKAEDEADLLVALYPFADDIIRESSDLCAREVPQPPHEVEMLGSTFVRSGDVLADPVLAGRAWVVLVADGPPVVRFCARHYEGARALAAEVRRLSMGGA